MNRKNLDRLFKKEVRRILEKNGVNGMLFEDVRREFRMDSEFNVEYRKKNRWDVFDYSDRFEMWVKRSGMLVKKLINDNGDWGKSYNRRWIVIGQLNNNNK